MQLKILKKDLQRKKSMNVILMIFILLTTMFVAASINNLMVVMNGVDDFIELANLGDYTIITNDSFKKEMNENERALEEFIKNSDYVDDYYYTPSLWVNASDFRTSQGDVMVFSNTLAMTDITATNQIYFNSDNEEIREVKKGEIYLPYDVMEKNSIETGDTVRFVLTNGYEKEFEVQGYFKDAFLGSKMMGNKALLISNEDFNEIADMEYVMRGGCFSVNCNNISKFKKDLNNGSFNIMFDCDKSTVKITYIMDMIIAGVLLMVGICLVVVSFIMLKFTITFTVNDDYKEIGIMKAIGIKDKSIRKLYLTKYAFISIVGAIVGFAASVPFSRILLEQITRTIVLNKVQSGILVEAITATLVALVVIAVAYRCTRKVKKLTPMDAIRNGNNGERFKRKSRMSFAKTRLKTTSFMAINDVRCQLKKYIVLMITSLFGTLLVIMPANTINTLSSDNVVDWFSMNRCDFYISDETKFMDLFRVKTKDALYDYVDETEAELKARGAKVDKVFIEALFRFTIKNGEYSFSSLASQGLKTDMDEYAIDEGSRPRYDNEIAITHIVADEINADIGDTVYIVTENGEVPYVITGLYQTMNNMGQGIRFTETADVDYSGLMGTFGLQVKMQKDASKADRDEAMEIARDIYETAKVHTSAKYIDDMIGGIAGQLESVKLIILIVVIAINILVVVLMQKMFLIREQGEMGMLKSIGFTNKAIVSWQTKRIVCTLLTGIVLGTLISKPFSMITSGQIFKLMGATKIRFEIKAMEVYVIYPVLIAVTTIIGCILTMRRVKKINVFNMNEID